MTVVKMVTAVMIGMVGTMVMLAIQVQVMILVVVMMMMMMVVVVVRVEVVTVVLVVKVITMERTKMMKMVRMVIVMMITMKIVTKRKMLKTIVMVMMKRWWMEIIMNPAGMPLPQLQVGEVQELCQDHYKICVLKMTSFTGRKQMPLSYNPFPIKPV